MERAGGERADIQSPGVPSPLRVTFQTWQEVRAQAPQPGRPALQPGPGRDHPPGIVVVGVEFSPLSVPGTPGPAEAELLGERDEDAGPQGTPRRPRAPGSGAPAQTSLVFAESAAGGSARER